MGFEEYQDYYQQGEILLVNNRPEQALLYYEKAEREDPAHPELYVSKCIAYVNLDRIEEAEQEAKKALLADRKHGEAYFHLGCIASLRGSVPEALKNFGLAETYGYREAQLYFSQGLMYEENKDVNMALRNYNKALERNSLRPDVHLRKAQLLIDHERRQEALQSLDQMILMCPDYFDGYHLKCGVLCSLARYEEAEQALAEGKEKFRQDVGFDLDMAKVFVHKGELEKGVAILLALLDDPRARVWKKDILMELARIAAQKEDAGKTLFYLEQADAHCRQNGQRDEEVCYLLASAYITQGNYPKCLDKVQELMEFGTNVSYNMAAHYYKGVALQRLGRPDQAREAYHLAVRKCRTVSLSAPGAVDSYIFRALALKELGEYPKALELVDYVLLLAPESAEVHSAKAVILQDMGRAEEARLEIRATESVNKVLGAVLRAAQKGG